MDSIDTKKETINLESPTPSDSNTAVDNRALEYKKENKELQKRVQELEDKLSLKEAQEVKSQLYVEYQLDGETQDTINSLLDTYKIKDYRSFIKDFSNFYLKKQSLDLNNFAPTQDKSSDA